MSKPIGELLQAFFAGRLGNQSPVEGRLREAWERLLGPEIATATEALSLRKGTLTVHLKDPLLRQELRLHSQNIAELLRNSGFTEVRRVKILIL
ncbi:MAG: DUF721 domain-containing protein [Bacteroidia bacterium]|nr:DUF721 domain-containing protein [Bacteroidia bacterium]